MHSSSHDIAIVGAGPIGLAVAIALRERGLDVVQFDKGQIGEIIFRFPPHMRFFSSSDRIAIGGVPIQSTDQSKCTREEYLAHLRSVVMHYGLDIRTYETVVHIARDRDSSRFTIATESLHGGRRYDVEKIVIATGGTATPRTLDIPGEVLPHVSHELGDPHRFFGRRVVIVGGRNSAVEAALRCHRAGAHVALTYRGAEFPKRVKYWLRPEIEALIHEGTIEAHFDSTPTEITPTHITLRNLETGEDVFVPADFILLMIGYDADPTVFQLAGVTLEGLERKPLYDPQTMETDVPGVFVAGTAIAGTQSRFAVYLENCHIHADRIAAALTGEPPPPAKMAYELPES